MHTKNICGKGREWLIRLNNNNYKNKMKSYFLSHISISPSQLLTPSPCAYEEAIVQFNEHPFATLTQS